MREGFRMILRFIVLVIRILLIGNFMKKNRFDRKMIILGCLCICGWVNGFEVWVGEIG